MNARTLAITDSRRLDFLNALARVGFSIGEHEAAFVVSLGEKTVFRDSERATIDDMIRRYKRRMMFEP